jgi:cytochrome c nitrite reductase small subunit
MAWNSATLGDEGGGEVADQEPNDPRLDEGQIEEPQGAPSSDAPAETPAGTPAETPGAGTAAPASVEKPPKKPSKHRRLKLAAIIVGAIIIVFAGASFATAEYTSRSKFCDSCHEMDPYYQSWQASVHKTADCRDCHIPPGFIPYVETKFGSLREVWVHFSSHPEAPLAVTRQIHNANCLDCHEDPGSVQLSDVTFQHSAHQVQNCITCHVRLVHRTVTPPSYVDPGKMSSCLKCHDGKTAPGDCTTCHAVVPSGTPPQ